MSNKKVENCVENVFPPITIPQQLFRSSENFNQTQTNTYNEIWFKCHQIYMKLEQRPIRDKKSTKLFNNTIDHMENVDSANILLARTESNLKRFTKETATLINRLSSSQNCSDVGKWNGDMIKSLFIAVPKYGTSKTNIIPTIYKKYPLHKISMVVHHLSVGRSNQTTSTISDDIETGKLLFEGIEHLKMVQELVGYLKNNLDVEKPKYLIDCQAFVDNDEMCSMQHKISFYQQLFEK